MSTSTSSLALELFKQTWPMLIGLLAIMSSQLIDSAFVGQLGAKPLAVLGFAIPVYQLVIGIQVGLGIATTATISTALGAGKLSYAKYLGTLILFFGTLIITLVCLALWYFQSNIALFLGANKNILQPLASYWLPWLISCWLGALLYFGYSICRAHGLTTMPGRVMVITSVLNILLDPLLIFTFDMGLAGAAWATSISFLIGCFIVFKTIFDQQLIRLHCALYEAKKGVKALIAFTIPAMLSQFIPPASAAFVTVLVASYGEMAIGAWGLANRIEYLSIILILALTMSLPPIIGKLRGKNDIASIAQVVKMAIIFVLSIQLVLAILMALIAPLITNIMTNEPDISTLLNNYLSWVPISYGALGVCMICVSACNAMGLPLVSLLISILRLFACYLPMLWLGSEMYGLSGLFIGAAIGNLLSGFVGWKIFYRYSFTLKTPKNSTTNKACSHSPLRKITLSTR